MEGVEMFLEFLFIVQFFIGFSRITPHGLVTHVYKMNRSWSDLIKVDVLMSETTDDEGVFCSAFIYNWAGLF
jgi:hypothetical protein